jgi:hypothetical protein
LNLNPIRSFVATFWNCAECRKHFLQVPTTAATAATAPPLPPPLLLPPLPPLDAALSFAFEQCCGFNEPLLCMLRFQ